MEEENTEKIVDDFTSDVGKLKGRDFWNVYQDLVNTHIEFVKSDVPSVQVWDDYKRCTNEFYKVDPDSKSEALNQFHQKLWREKLPKRFGSDIIVTNFICYEKRDKNLKNRFKDIIESDLLQDYQAFVDEKMRQFYCNIGSFIIFPRMGVRGRPTINMVRGRWPFCDRFDLILEYIRIYYERKNNNVNYKFGTIDEAIYKKLFDVKDVEDKPANQAFFNSFGDFQRYVNFFCLDDLVENGQVRDLMHNGCYITDKSFDDPFPKDPKEYVQWMENQLEFVQKRTKRINQVMR